MTTDYHQSSFIPAPVPLKEKRGTYSRIGVSLSAGDESWDGSIRVDFQEIGVEVLSLSVSSIFRR